MCWNDRAVLLHSQWSSWEFYIFVPCAMCYHNSKRMYSFGCNVGAELVWAEQEDIKFVETTSLID